jgi:hypothetical protein
VKGRPAPGRALLLVAGALASCSAGPGLRIDTTEPDADLYLDGRVVGQGAVEIPFRFYGASSVTAVPQRHDPRESVRAPAQARVHIDPPAPQWLFPFDFCIEAVRRGFASAPPIEVAVELPPPLPTLPSGTRPTQAQELRDRAARERRAR